MLSKNFMSNKSNDTNTKSFFINLDHQYTFTRTYFLLEPNLYVEMVTLAMEYNRVEGRNLITQNEVLSSDSRELDTKDVSKSFVEALHAEDTIKEEYKLTKEQVDMILKNYKDNLFDVNKEVLDSLN